MRFTLSFSKSQLSLLFHFTKQALVCQMQNKLSLFDKYLLTSNIIDAKLLSNEEPGFVYGSILEEKMICGQKQNPQRFR